MKENCFRKTWHFQVTFHKFQYPFNESELKTSCQAFRRLFSRLRWIVFSLAVSHIHCSYGRQNTRIEFNAKQDYKSEKHFLLRYYIIFSFLSTDICLQCWSDAQQWCAKRCADCMQWCAQKQNMQYKDNQCSQTEHNPRITLLIIFKTIIRLCARKKTKRTNFRILEIFIQW